MSYSISISGHVTSDDPAATEQAIADAFKSAIASLPAEAGLSFASASFQYLGGQSLLPVPAADEAAAVEPADQVAPADSVEATPAAADEAAPEAVAVDDAPAVDEVVAAPAPEPAGQFAPEPDETPASS